MQSPGEGNSQGKGSEAGLGTAQVRRVEGDQDGKVLGLPSHPEDSGAHFEGHWKPLKSSEQSDIT